LELSVEEEAHFNSTCIPQQDDATTGKPQTHIYPLRGTRTQQGNSSGQITPVVAVGGSVLLA